MRWIAISLPILGLFDILCAQNARYGPSSTEWLQSGHDYKKTRRAPLKCTSPANVYRAWTSEDSPGFIGSGSAVYNNTFDYQNNGSVEVSGGGEDAGFMSSDLKWRLHNAGGGIITDINFGDEGYYLSYWATGFAGNEARVVIQHDYEESDQWDSNIYYQFRVQRGNGSVIYSQTICQNTLCQMSDMTVADIDNNNCPEVYVQHASNFRAINLCANSYSLIWSVGQDGQTRGSAIGKVQNTSDWDVVISNISPSGIPRIIIRNASNGAYKTTINLASLGSDQIMTLPTLSDINNDGKDEIFVGVGACTTYDPNFGNCISSIGRLYALNYNGIIWQRDLNNIPSNIAIGRILPNNELGLTVNVGNLATPTIGCGSLAIIRPSDGQIIAQGIGSGDYCGAPSIADMNADGIEGAIVSNGCGNPREHSYVNGWTNPVWAASGCADEPPITSDLVISKWYMDYNQNPPTGRLVIVEGDASCFTNVWHCNSAEETTPVNFNETWIRPKVYYSNGYVNIENYSGNLEIYDVMGRKVLEGKVENKASFKVKSGVYIVKLQDEIVKLVANGR